VIYLVKKFNIIRKTMLAQINVINWIDFHSWKRDYDMQQKYDLYQLIKKERGQKGLEMIMGLMEDD